MRAGEKRRLRQPRELLERDPRVLESLDRVEALLHEPPRERAVLVERRLAGRAVLLEREGQLGAAVSVAREDREGGEAEAAQRLLQRQRADGHPPELLGAPRESLSPPGWQVGHQ